MHLTNIFSNSSIYRNLYNYKETQISNEVTAALFISMFNTLTCHMYISLCIYHVCYTYIYIYIYIKIYPVSAQRFDTREIGSGATGFKNG